MARPETSDDIELEPIQIAIFHVDAMGVTPDLLLGYAAFLKAMEKAKATVTASYSTVTVTRALNADETRAQLTSKQNSWDERQKQYETFAAVGKCEYSYQDDQARRHAEAEDLPWPPEVESVALEDTLDRIDAVVAE